MTTTTANRHGTAQGVTAWVLPVVVAAALVIDAVVHLRLAGVYQQSASGGIGVGNLFRIEAVAAVVVALWML